MHSIRSSANNHSQMNAIFVSSLYGAVREADNGPKGQASVSPTDRQQGRFIAIFTRGMECLASIRISCRNGLDEVRRGLEQFVFLISYSSLFCKDWLLNVESVPLLPTDTGKAEVC